MTSLGPMPDVAGCISLTLSGLVGGHAWVNKFHVNYSGTPPTSGQMAAYCAGVNDGWIGGIADICSVGVSLLKIEAVDLSSRTAAVGILDVTSFGTVLGAYNPANAAVLVDYDIAIRYRGGHPRTYLPAGVQADLETESTWLDASLSNFTAGFQNFLNFIENVTYDGFVFGGQCFLQAVVTVPPPPAWRTPPVTRIITGFNVQKELASQRRRIGRK